MTNPDVTQVLDVLEAFVRFAADEAQVRFGQRRGAADSAEATFETGRHAAFLTVLHEIRETRYEYQTVAAYLETQPRDEWTAEVTGWDADGEPIEWSGWGDTEDEAIETARRGGRIVEIGDVRTYCGTPVSDRERAELSDRFHRVYRRVAAID